MSVFEERDYHQIPESKRELRKTISTISDTLNRNGDLNRDRAEIDQLSKTLSRHITNFDKEKMAKEQLASDNKGYSVGLPKLFLHYYLAQYYDSVFFK
jgi:PBP1b-binding outer membrane lipoprotein LpoB